MVEEISCYNAEAKQHLCNMEGVLSESRERPCENFCLCIGLTRDTEYSSENFMMEMQTGSMYG